MSNNNYIIKGEGYNELTAEFYQALESYGSIAIFKDSNDEQVKVGFKNGTFEVERNRTAFEILNNSKQIHYKEGVVNNNWKFIGMI